MSQQGISIGDRAPDFALPDTDGETRRLSSGPAVIYWTCNHCPYALAWHDRLLDVARDYEGRAEFLAVNSNDADRYPADSPRAMRERVEAEGGWPHPYLYDESQEVARAYDAKTTPDCFLIDAEGRIVYRGAPDADYQDPSLNAVWLRGAIDAVLAGAVPEPAETKPVGCSIKWKQ